MYAFVCKCISVAVVVAAVVVAVALAVVFIILYHPVEHLAIIFPIFIVLATAATAYR